MATYKDLTQIANYEHYTDSKAWQYTSNQTNTVLLTPATGKRLRIHDVYCNTAATSGNVTIEFTNSGYEFYHFSTSSTTTRDHQNMREVGEINESIRLTSTTSTSALNLLINFTEVVDAGESTKAETSSSTSTTTTSTSTTTTSTSTTTTSTSSTTTSTSSTTTSSSTTSTSTTTP